MKTQWIPGILLAAALVALPACKKTETTETTSMETETATMATDTAATTETTSTAAASLSAEDQEFVTKAGMGGLAEVQMGNLVQPKAANADVKTFAQKMVTDHSAANQELQQLAMAKGVTLPTELAGDHKAALDHLATLSGAALDKAYMQHMVEDHVKDVAEFEKASTTAQDPDVKAFAAKTLPVLQQHLQLAKDTSAKLK